MAKEEIVAEGTAKMVQGCIGLVNGLFANHSPHGGPVTCSELEAICKEYEEIAFLNDPPIWEKNIQSE